MRMLRKVKYLIFPVLAALLFSGCEQANELIVASFSNATADGSENFAAKLNFQQDKRMEEKFFDVQIMLDTENTKIVFWKEGEDKVTVTIAEKNRWKSLTSLQVGAAGLAGTEDFTRLKDAVDVTYIFNTEKPVKIFLRVVAGEAVDNSAGTGKILANTEPVSKDFVLECK